MAKRKKDVEKPAEPEVAQAEPAPPEPPKVEEPAPYEGSFTGERIKRMREQKGLSLKEIAERTKISVAVLQALEDERYEDMPSARVYVRGFVRCLAEEIGLDKDQVSQGYVPRWERWFSESGRRY